MSQFYTLLTAIGQAKLANAIALDQPFSIADLAIGDGGGTMPDIDASATALVNEVRRAAVNRVETDADNPNWLIVEQVLPPDVGGFTIREAGVYDADGDLIAIGTYPATYKPQLAEGASRTQTIRFVMMVSDTSAITLKVDPAVVLATRGYVDNTISTHAQSRNHPAATESALGFVELADAAEADAGTDDQRAMTPAKVKRVLPGAATTTKAGLVEQATTDEAIAASDNTRFVTPNGVVQSYRQYGLGPYEMPRPPDIDNLPGTGFFTGQDANGTYPGGIYDEQYFGIIKLVSGGGYEYQIGMPRNSGNGAFFLRSLNKSGAWPGWVKGLTSGNTTVDSNGFIKQSSPIVRLYLDRIETNQDIGAVLAKQAVGVYRIDGTPGLAREGWQIETPRDANGQIVLYVETRERADHTIEITTYTPVWTEGVVGPGAPVDIPEGRWIDLRLAEPDPESDTPTEAAS